MFLSNSFTRLQLREGTMRWGKGFQELVQRTHVQKQREVGSRVGSRDGWGGGNGGGKMDIAVLEQQLNF